MLRLATNILAVLTPLVFAHDNAPTSGIGQGEGTAAHFGLDERILTSSDVPHVLTALGNQKQLVGWSQGQEPYSMISDMLHEACPAEATNCSTKSVFKITQLAYFCANTTNNNVCEDGYLDVIVEGNNFPDRFRGIREPLIHQVAAALTIAADNSGNCYRETHHDDQPLFWCNIPDRASVLIRIPGSNDTPYLDVSLISDEKVAEDSLDCFAMLEAVRTYLTNNTDEVKDQFKSSLDVGDVVTEATCLSSDVKPAAASSEKLPLSPLGHRDSANYSGLSISNDTDLASNQSSVESNNPVLHITVSHNGQGKVYVGQHTSSYFYQFIYQAISQLCPQGKSGQDICNVPDARKLTGIQYWDGKKVQTDGYAWLQVRHNWFPPDQPGWREFFMEAVAMTFFEETLDDKNCVKNNYPGYGDVRWCNVGREVTVRSDTGQNTDAFITVHIQGEKPEKSGGCFDCKAILQAVDADARASRLDFWAAAILGYGDDKHVPVLADCHDWEVQC